MLAFAVARWNCAITLPRGNGRFSINLVGYRALETRVVTTGVRPISVYKDNEGVLHFQILNDGINDPYKKMTRSMNDNDREIQQFSNDRVTMICRERVRTGCLGACLG